MVFSTAYYSPLTLLPLDPPPFTIPTASRSPRKNQPTVTLEDYPLPDGSWRWVSRAWMIDMRGDGEVQYDGFEYARSFRSKKWGPDTGFMSNCGLVRRRRWLRLMMRPARAMHDTESFLEHAGNVSVLPEMEHHEEGATRPPSVMFTGSDDSEESGVWRGDEGDWDRCHRALRHLARDGRKLEVWAHWLGISEEAPTSSRWRPSIPVVSPFLVSLPQATKSGETKEASSCTPSTEVVATMDSPKTRGDKFFADVGAGLTQGPREHVAVVIRCHVRSRQTVCVVIRLLIRDSLCRVQISWVCLSTRNHVRSFCLSSDGSVYRRNFERVWVLLIVSRFWISGVTPRILEMWTRLFRHNEA